jgi:hypothetical protein
LFNTENKKKKQRLLPPELPLDMLHEIASYSEGAYRALLALPVFARSLTVNARADYWCHFGYGVTVYATVIEWTKHDERHRNDGPALEYISGLKIWYSRGQVHNDKGHATEWTDGTKGYYRNGLCHRDDGPAMEWADGERTWYHNDEVHRDDGPAFEKPGHFKSYVQHGKLHRAGGLPALEYEDGRKFYYLHGVAISPSQSLR